MQCIDCSGVGLLDTFLNKCVSFCPYGFKNVFDICVKCFTEDCAELKEEFF